MATDDPKGGRRVLSAAVKAASARLAEAPQLALLPEDDAGPEAAVPLPVAKRGPGRPPGSVNKRTAEFVDLALRPRYRSPLQVLAEIWSRSTVDLAAQLHCSELEAFQEQRRAAEASLPYWEQKRPMPVELNGNLMTVVFEAPTAGGGGPQGAGFTVQLDASDLVEAVAARDEKSEENQ